jgi:hypothetical protein
MTGHASPLNRLTCTLKSVITGLPKFTALRALPKKILRRQPDFMTERSGILR